MTNTVDERGYYVLSDHHLVDLRMHGISDSTLPEGYGGDILSELSAVLENGMLRLEFASVMGSGGTVLCRAVEVVAVVPCGPDGVPLS